MVSRRTRVASWIFRRDHPSRPNAMICCFFSSFKTFAMLREATYPPAAVNVLDVSSESMAAFQVFLYGRFWVITEASERLHRALVVVLRCTLRPFDLKRRRTLCGYDLTLHQRSPVGVTSCHTTFFQTRRYRSFLASRQRTQQGASLMSSPSPLLT